MKKTFTVLFLLICSISFSNLFGQDYETLVKKANLSYKKNDEITALNLYWDAMKLTLGEKNEAFEQYTKISEDIMKPMEISKDCDEFTIYETWENRLMAFEEYYSKHIPFIFTITPLTQESLDYEKKTAKYSFTVKEEVSEKYKAIRNIYSEGLKNNRTEEWISFPSTNYWPTESIFQSMEKAQEKNVFLIKNIENYSSKYTNATLACNFVLDIILYDKDTNDIIKNYSVIPTNRSSIYLEDIPYSIIKQIKKKKILCKVDKITLLHGEFTSKTISKNNSYTTYDKYGRAIIHLPSDYWEEENPNYIPKLETAVPLKSVSIHLPYKKYKKDINPIYLAAELDFAFIEGGPINAKQKDSITINDFYVCKTPVYHHLFTNFIDDYYYNNNGEGYAQNVEFKTVMKFCNQLSVIMGYEPCYSFNGETDPEKWIKYPHMDYDWGLTEEQKLLAKQWDEYFVCDFNANGFRIPTYEETLYLWKNNLVPLAKEWCWIRKTEPTPFLDPSIFIEGNISSHSCYTSIITDRHMPFLIRLVRTRIN